jgi:hypothetical protein
MVTPPRVRVDEGECSLRDHKISTDDLLPADWHVDLLI